MFQSSIFSSRKIALNENMGWNKSRKSSIRKKWTTTLSLQDMFRSIIHHLQLQVFGKTSLHILRGIHEHLRKEGTGPITFFNSTFATLWGIFWELLLTLESSCFPPVPKPTLESYEKQLSSLLPRMLILALEHGYSLLTAFNPSLLQLDCKEACEPISDFQLLIYHPMRWRGNRHQLSVSTESWRSC